MLTSYQLTLLALVPKLTSSMSIFGSLYIIVHVISSPRERKKPHLRLLAGMSVLDLFESCAQFMSTWPTPVGTSNAKFAVGNTTTCTIQGFFTNFNIGVALYNTSLSVYYLLIVRYKFTKKRINKVELVMHLIPLSYAFVSGTIFAVDDAFNFSGRFCWVSQLPLGCTGADCLRGKRASLYQWIIFYIIITCLIFATVSMIALYWTVRHRDNSVRNLNIAYEVGVQAVLYLGAFYVTWIFSIANRVYFLVHGVLPFPLHLVAATVHPLQGALNVLVYLRKDVMQMSKNKNSNIIATNFEATVVTTKTRTRRLSQIPPMKKKDTNLEGVKISIHHELDDEFDDMSSDIDQIPFAKSVDIVVSNEII